MKLMIIALSNMRKHKSSIVVTGILVACAMLLLYSSINSIGSVTNHAADVNKKQNAADVILYTSYEDKEKVFDFFDSQEEITEYESRGFYSTGVKYHNVTMDSKKEQMEFRIMNEKDKTNISNFIIYDKQKEWKENSIILPMYLKTGLGFHSGDEIELEYALATQTYEIYGFIEDVMFPNPNTVGMYECIVSSEEYERVASYGCLAGNAYFVKIDEKLQPFKYVNDFRKNIDDHIPGISSSVVYYINDSQSMCYAASVWAYTIMALFAVFAIFIIVIAVIVIRFTIVTTLEDNLPNIGILEAGGYTSKQMIFANMVEYLSTTIIGILLGLAGAVGVKGLLENIVNATTGLKWQEEFSPVIAVICGIILILMVALTIRIASRRMKKITPLDALRDGIHTHNFKKNPISLEKSTLPLNLSIGCKNILQSLKQNISILIIVCLLTFICAVFFNVYYNVAVDPDGIIRLVGIEKCDIAYEINNTNGMDLHFPAEGTDKKDADYWKMCDRIKEIEGVQNAFPCGSGSTYLTNGKQNTQIELTAYDDFSQLKINTIVEGRYPEENNEIVLATKTAEQLKVEIGDVVYAESGEKSNDFVVVGIEQHMYNVGTGALVNFDGLQKISPDVEINNLFVYTEEDVDIDTIIKEIKDAFGDYQSNLANFDEYFTTILATFSSAIGAMSLFSLVSTMIIVCLIIYLLIKMKLLRDRRMLGIYKALGFTTPQLVGQTVLSYIPVIGTGALLGGGLAILIGNKTVAAVFRVISGIQKCNFTTVYSYIILSVVLVIVAALAIAVACSAKIRKIEPCKMIQEQ
ncbi:ABC transporter permease [Anaerosporobacter faecicola]|uniref:ABC transporter permease n=1 Tax=Anaerosporobacter faecicola TaxID=2718714 RepID=UPI00143C7E17|nr:FtsX-like permease family protein [Anaerosporobacter faecicola]